MVLPAVELDDQPARRPREVDLHSLDEDVGLGRRETAVIEEGGEASLEVASGVGGWRERSEVGGASLRRVPVWLRAFEAEALGLVDGLLELVFLEDAGQVEQGAGGGGDGDAVVGGDLVGGENGSVKEESGSLPASDERVVISMRPFHGRMAPESAGRAGGSAPRRSPGLPPSTAPSVRPRGGPRRTPRGEEGGACPIRLVSRSPGRRFPPRAAALALTTPCCLPARPAITASGARLLAFAPYAVVNVSDLGSRPR